MSASRAHALITVARRLGQLAADLGMHAGSLHEHELDELERDHLEAIALFLEAAAGAIRDARDEAPAAP